MNTTEILTGSLAIIGTAAIVFLLVSCLTGYTWIGMPAGGGCWP